MKILLALDGSDESEHALQAVCKRLWQPGTTVRVLMVIRPVPVSFSFWPEVGVLGWTPAGVSPASWAVDDRMRDVARTVAQRACERLDRAGVIYEYKLATGDPAAEICSMARDWRADLIVVGTHGYRGLQRLLHGSVSESVLKHAPCSVEIIREPEHA